MRDRFLRRPEREYGPSQRLTALAGEAIFLIGVFPLALLFPGGLLDRWLGWPKLVLQPANAIVGWLVIASGWLLAIRSIYVQFTLGRGAPVPVMATQKLIVQPPYTYCRNPMALGVIVLYLGVSLVAGSPGAAVLWLLGAVALLAYIRLIEEKRWSRASARRTWCIIVVYRSSSPG